MFKPLENTDPLQSEYNVNRFFSQKGLRERIGIITDSLFISCSMPPCSRPPHLPLEPDYGAGNREGRTMADRHGSKEEKRKIFVGQHHWKNKRR